MVKQSPHTRWKGCAMCKPHKFKSQGDAARLLTPQVMRLVGVDSRWNRHSVAPAPDYPDNPDAEEIDCQHGCNGDCYRDGSDKCNFTCHPGRVFMRFELEPGTPCVAGVHILHPQWGPRPCPRTAERLVVTEEGDLPLCVEHYDFVCALLDQEPQ